MVDDSNSLTLETARQMSRPCIAMQLGSSLSTTRKLVAQLKGCRKLLGIGFLAKPQKLVGLVSISWLMLSRNMVPVA